MYKCNFLTVLGLHGKVFVAGDCRISLVSRAHHYSVLVQSQLWLLQKDPLLPWAVLVVHVGEQTEEMKKLLHSSSWGRGVANVRETALQVPKSV